MTARAVARLCLATDSTEPSGVGELMLALAGELRNRHDVTLACPASQGGRILLDRAAALGLAIRRLDDATDREATWLRRTGFDLVHVHAGVGWEGHDLAVAARTAGIPRVVRTEHLPDVITDPLQRRQHAEGLAWVDRLICVSEAAAATFFEAGVDPALVATIRNGLSPRPALRSRRAVRASLGLAQDWPVALMAARFTAQKGHAVLVEALPGVLARHPDLRVLLAGTGPDEATMRERGAGLGDRLRFLGHRTDVPDLLACADMLLLPSRFEGLPLVALEAMAAGLPVLGTAVGGTSEAVLDGETGRLVPPGDPAAFAAAMIELLDDPAAGRRYGAAGRRRFRTVFTSERMAAETDRLYTGLGTEPLTKGKRMGDGRTRIGFIGAGGIAQRHLGVLEHFPDVELVAFADPAEERAVAAAERFGARAYGAFEAMLGQEELDALYICVPPFAHGAAERAAIAKGLPFFVEKPLALDLALAEEIALAVEAAGLVTAVGYHWRYLDTVDEARHHLADRPAQFLSGYWLDSTPPPQWWWRQDGSGGQLNEQTTHIVDLARLLVGDVVQVYGSESRLARPDFPELDIATASTASLRFASGAVGNIGSTCLLHWNHRVGLHLFADGLAMELTDHDIMVDVGHGRPVRHAEGDPVVREDRDFIDAVRGGENRIRCPYHEALKTLRVTDAIARSARTGTAVNLPVAEPNLHG